MDTNKINISKIETFLNEKLDGLISDNTFFTALPDASVVKSSDWKDMVLIDIPNGVRDHDAYGQGTVLVYLYARPMESGRKNVAVLSKLETKLNDAIKCGANDTYYIKRRLTYTGYDTNIDWHYNVVEIIITIY